jgi:cytochrome P450
MSTRTSLPAFELFGPDAWAHAGGALPGGPLAVGSDGYSVMSYELASAVLRDSRFKNSALTLMESFGITSGRVHENRARSILLVEGAAHLRMRMPLARFMSPATVSNTRSVLRQIVADIADDLDDAAPVEFHATVDRRIPSRVYCHLAGAPPEDAPKVQDFSERVLALLNRDPELIPDILQAYDEIFEYIEELIARKREQGLGDDMLSYLVSLEDQGTLTQDELIAEAVSMLEASSVNTAHQTGLVVWTLLRDRDVWARLVADPTLIPAAVVEALRLYPRTGVVSKILEEDVDLAGVTVPAGSDVHVAIWSANRDPERFELPDRFDLDRERNQPLTFSTGAHNCLGQGLAKAEMEEVIHLLVDRYPDATVDETATEIDRIAGRWLVKSLTLDLKG